MVAKKHLPSPPVKNLDLRTVAGQTYSETWYGLIEHVGGNPDIRQRKIIARLAAMDAILQRYERDTLRGIMTAGMSVDAKLCRDYLSVARQYLAFMESEALERPVFKSGPLIELNPAKRGKGDAD